MSQLDVFIISGFDATASAGILLDAHICKILGNNPYCILPAFLVQNHSTVSNSRGFSQQEITTQLEISHPLPTVAKVGLLQTTEAILAVAKFFQLHPQIKLITDTPIISTSGKKLVEDIPTYITTFKNHLLPLVYLLTPNSEELSMFGKVDDILQTGCKNVLVKGGHTNETQCRDTLYTHNGSHEFTLPRIDVAENIRGTGCSLSTAIACYITHGKTLEEAIDLAKQFVFNGIKNSTKVNKTARILKF